jgi:hypothetical protein
MESAYLNTREEWSYQLKHRFQQTVKARSHDSAAVGSTFLDIIEDEEVQFFTSLMTRSTLFRFPWRDI